MIEHAKGDELDSAAAWHPGLKEPTFGIDSIGPAFCWCGRGDFLPGLAGVWGIFDGVLIDASLAVFVSVDALKQRRAGSRHVDYVALLDSGLGDKLHSSKPLDGGGQARLRPPPVFLLSPKRSAVRVPDLPERDIAARAANVHMAIWAHLAIVEARAALRIDAVNPRVRMDAAKAALDEEFCGR